LLLKDHCILQKGLFLLNFSLSVFSNWLYCGNTLPLFSVQRLSSFVEELFSLCSQLVLFCRGFVGVLLVSWKIALLELISILFHYYLFPLFLSKIDINPIKERLADLRLGLFFNFELQRMSWFGAYLIIWILAFYTHFWGIIIHLALNELLRVLDSFDFWGFFVFEARKSCLFSLFA
jgi:hypothetical protein